LNDKDNTTLGVQQSPVQMAISTTVLQDGNWI